MNAQKKRENRKQNKKCWELEEREKKNVEKCWQKESKKKEVKTGKEIQEKDVEKNGGRIKIKK